MSELLTNCTIGTKILLPFGEEDNVSYSTKDISPFFGQIGPVYLFNDAITPEQVQGVFSLGPSYMHSFLDNESPLSSDGPFPGGIFDAKDGLAPKMILGLNAQVLFMLMFLICGAAMFCIAFISHRSYILCDRQVISEHCIMLHP